jgi:ABC-type uncharacterized transport system YnjBCD permease subunit
MASNAPDQHEAAEWLHALPVTAWSAMAEWLHELDVGVRVRGMRVAKQWLISIVVALIAAIERLHVRRRVRWARRRVRRARRRVGHASPLLLAIVLVVGVAFLVERSSG